MAAILCATADACSSSRDTSALGSGFAPRTAYWSVATRYTTIRASPVTSASSCAANGSVPSTANANTSAAAPDRYVCSHVISANRLESFDAERNTGCTSAAAASERMPCVPSTVTARSMLSTGVALAR